MALSGVSFEIIEEGLGIINPSDDNISALLFSAAAPTAFAGQKIKGYTSLSAVKADGITGVSVVYGESYYHIEEFFRINNGALLYVCFGLTDVVEELYNATGGKVRQIGAFTNNLGNVEAVYQAYANAFTEKYAPLSFIVGYEPTTTPSSINLLDDLSLKYAPNVSIVIFGDDNGRGAGLAGALGKPYVSAVGTVLGLTSKARVSQSIGALTGFNISNGVEFSKTENGTLKAAIRYVTGEKYSDGVTLQFVNKRYLAPRFYANYAGIYVEKDHTATSPTKDLKWIRHNRTIGKALRGIRAKLLPRLKSEIYVDSQGRLDADQIEYLKGLASNDLNQMKRDGEISDFGVAINPEQNIVQTNELAIEMRLLAVGSADFIKVRLGFAASLAGF